MIDLQSDALVPLREVPDLLPRRRGRKIHISSVYRWVQRGVDGRRLETLKVGGVLFTSLAALERFFARQGGVSGSATPPAGPPSDRALDAEADAHGL